MHRPNGQSLLKSTMMGERNARNLFSVIGKYGELRKQEIMQYTIQKRCGLCLSGIYISYFFLLKNSLF